MDIHPPSRPPYSALYAIAALATGSTEVDSAQLALEEIVRSLGAHSGCLFLLNPDTARLELEAQHGLSVAEQELAFDIGQGLPGWAALHGQPYLAPDVAAESRYRAMRAATRSQMVAPLMVDERTVGVVVVDHDEANHFTTDALGLLEMLSQETARVLRRLWLLAQLEGKARQLETLIAIGHTLVGKLEPDVVFDSLTRDARQIFGSRACALYLHDSRADTVRCVSLAAPAHIVRPSEVLPTASCLVGVTVHTRRQTEFADIRSPEFLTLADLPDDPELHSVLITPLIYENEVLGALAIFSDRVQRYDNDSKRLNAGLASLGAVALENARLYARVFQSEATLRKNEQLTTLGLLAAEIAHEIRNPLTVLKLLHGGLGLDFPEGDPRRTDMRVIGEKLDQLEEIVLRVLQFGKSPAADLHSRWSLVDIVNDTLVLVRLKFSQSKIHLQFDYPVHTSMVEGHKGQLQQVLLNLLLNSTQAMPLGGRITLAIKPAAPGESHSVALEVSDTGHGIPTEFRERIFDSFLSGRPDGTGLGLSIAKRVLLSHHGDITLVSSGPEGTTLRITLPTAR